MKSFDEIYEELKKIDVTELNTLKESEKKKKITITSIILAIVIIGLVFIFSKIQITNYLFLIPFIAFFIFFVFVIVMSIGSGKYNTLFKNTVIKKFINQYDNNLDFDSINSIPKHIYKEAEFEGFDIYHSNDLVFGKLDGEIDFQLGDVHTESE